MFRKNDQFISQLENHTGVFPREPTSVFSRSVLNVFHIWSESMKKVHTPVLRFNTINTFSASSKTFLSEPGILYESEQYSEYKYSWVPLLWVLLRHQ